MRRSEAPRSSAWLCSPSRWELAGAGEEESAVVSASDRGRERSHSCYESRAVEPCLVVQAVIRRW